MTKNFTSFTSFSDKKPSLSLPAEAIYFSLREMTEIHKIDQQLQHEQLSPSETSLRIIREHSIRTASLLAAE